MAHLDAFAATIGAAAPAVLNHVSIVIPAFNEEHGLAATLEGLLVDAPAAEIIVVDDGSTDGTHLVCARFPQVRCIRHRFNRGYGAALKTGMSSATRDYVAWFDADNEHRVADLIALAERMANEPVAAIIAQRKTPGPSPLRRWGKLAIRLLAMTLSADVGKDINCGLRIFHTDIIKRYMPLLPNTYSASITSTIVLLERGYPIGYHPVQLNKRIGVSKVRIADGFHALMLILRLTMLFAPMRIFLRVGMLLFCLGLVYSTSMATFLGRGVPTSGVALMLLGALSGFAGLIADQISQLRLAHYDHAVYRYD